MCLEQFGIPSQVWPVGFQFHCPNAALETNNVITSEGFFHAGFMTGNGGATGTYGFLSGFNDAYEFQNPYTGLPSTIYTVDTLCPGETIRPLFC